MITDVNISNIIEFSSEQICGILSVFGGKDVCG